MEVPLTVAAAGSPAPGDILLERYRIAELIGRGELGNVYAADDLLRVSIADQSGVAIKAFHRVFLESCGGLRGLAPRLAAVCRLSHPNVVNVHDFYADGDELYVIMERVTGRTLAGLLERPDGKPPLSLAEAEAALRQLIDTLSYIHTASASPLLWLNPRKVWLTADRHRVCLADLGLAPLMDPALLVQAAMAAGHSVYLAPEVLCGQGLADCRADQFSLGKIAVALFTGSPKGTAQDLEAALGRTAAAPWLEHLPRLLAADPAGRFPDLASLREALEDARRPSRFWSPRPKRSAGQGSQPPQARRRRLAMAGVATLGLALAVWHFGPGLWADREWRRESISQAEQARRDLHLLEDLRLKLFAAAAGRLEFAEGLRWRANAKPEFETAARIDTAARALASGRSEDAVALLTEVSVALEERESQFTAALATVAACDRLGALSEPASRWREPVPLPEAASPATLDAARLTAVRAFAAGNFAAAATAAGSAAAAADDALAELAARQRDEAEASREAWRTALLALGDFPAIEPVTKPAARMEAGEAALQAGDRLAAAREFIAAREDYRAWTSEFKDLTADPSGGSGDPVQPAAFTNSLGMRFVAAGDLLASIWETRLIDFLAFVEETGADAGRKWFEVAAATRQYASISVGQGPLHPVTYIGVADAARFCQWLTRREHASGLLRAELAYRLPSDLEWSLLAGLEEDPDTTPYERSLDHPDHFPWGPSPQRRADSGNYDTWPNRAQRADKIAEQDPFLQTAPVGSFPPNAQGLFDLGGNVWEWTVARPGDLAPPGEAIIIRGGGWRSISLDTMRTAYRLNGSQPHEEIGFRVVLAPADGSAGAAADAGEAAPGPGNEPGEDDGDE